MWVVISEQPVSFLALNVESFSWHGDFKKCGKLQLFTVIAECLATVKGTGTKQCKKMPTVCEVIDSDF